MKSIRSHSVFTLLLVKRHFPIGQNLDGKLGEGGPAIDLSTVNGGIRIDRSKSVALENR